MSSNVPLSQLNHTPPAATRVARLYGKGWLSPYLRPLWMVLLLFIEIAFIVAIVLLERISAQHNGIASVPQIASFSTSHSVIADIWRYGLLWTTLPTWIMSIYALMWNSAVSATAYRQPFIELRQQRHNAANARMTIMLDYRSYPSAYNWIVAFLRCHVLIGTVMLLSLFMSLVVIPLMSYLFVPAPSQSSSTVSFIFNTSFNASAFTARTTLQPAIDLANAIRTYGANPPPWMTSEFAFETFSIQNNTALGNVTSTTNAYSAYLDCQAFTTSSVNATVTYDSGFVTASINDRGCEVSEYFAVQNTTETYIRSWNTECSGSDYGRIGLFGAIYSATSSIMVANLVAVSCIPTYSNTSGSLTLSLQPNASPQFISFTPDRSALIHPIFYPSFESVLHDYTFFDPSNIFSADAFGFSVYSYARSQNDTFPLQPELLKNATQDIFTTIYAGLVNTQFLNPAASPRTAQGTLSTPVTRLYVVTYVAYIVVGFLAVILVCNILLFIYATRKSSILTHEPVGLLGSAAVLHKSDVENFVADFEQRHGRDCDMRKLVKNNYTVETSKCWYDEQQGRIRIEGLEVI